jgi:VIT1/CCC1 family predicted Fe2+/Mn2+ transporter
MGEGGPSTTGFVWRSIKKIILSVMLIGLLALATLVTSLDQVWQGKISLQTAVANSYIAALAKGFTGFIPKFLLMFQYFVANQPAQAFVLCVIPNILVFLTLFLWMSVIADILDMQKHEAIGFHWVLLATLALLVIFSVSAIGIQAAMNLFGGVK